MDRIIEEVNYRMFLMNQVAEQQKMDRYIQECLAIAEGSNVYDKICVLNEGIGDKISEWWQKFKAFMARVWGKFVENVTKLATSDKGYCEKYKDIILKKPLKEDHFPIEMKPCNVGVSRIVNAHLPIYSTNMLDKINLTDGDKNVAFKKFLLHDYNGDVEFQDFAKDYFIGGSEEQKYESHAINMTDLYNFCTTYDNIVKNIKTDNDNLSKAVTSIEAAMKMQTPKPTPTTTQPTSTKPADTTTKDDNNLSKKVGDGDTGATNGKVVDHQSYRFNSDGKTYSAVYEQYITELQTADNKTAGTGGTAPNPNNNLNSATKNNVDKAHDTSSEDQRQAALNKETDQSVEQKGRIYTQTGMQFLTAKMTAAEFIKKEYMSIIKMHVQDYVGTNDTKDVGAKTGTDVQNKTQELSDADKNTIIELIKSAESADEKDKPAMMRSVVRTVREKTGNTFTGDYNAAKQLVGYTGK
jgi:hypothetical protein